MYYRLRGGRVLDLTEEQKATFEKINGRDCLRPASLQEFLAAQKEAGVYPGDMTRLFFPFWDFDMPADGYGGVALNLKYECKKYGVLLETSPQESQEVAFIYKPPDWMERFITRYEQGEKRYYKILYTMHETTEFPQKWLKYMELADLVIVPSQWLKEALEKQKFAKPVAVWHHGIPDQEYTYTPREFPVTGKFRFLHYNGGNIRKGYQFALQAFTEEFTPDEPVEFVIKSIREKAETKYYGYKQVNPNIQIISRPFERPEMEALLHSCHCFVFPSQGEGFGMPPLEAMKTGLPCILTKAHAFLDYWNEGCYGVRAKKVKPQYVPHNLLHVVGPYPKEINEKINAEIESYQFMNTGSWYEPNVKDIRRRMREVYTNYTEALERGRIASEYVEKHHNMEKITLDLLEILKQYTSICQ